MVIVQWDLRCGEDHESADCHTDCGQPGNHAGGTGEGAAVGVDSGGDLHPLPAGTGDDGGRIVWPVPGVACDAGVAGVYAEGQTIWTAGFNHAPVSHRWQQNLRIRRVFVIPWLNGR